MKEYGYVRVAALSPQIRVADLDYNKTSIVEAIRQAAGAGASVIVLPELCVTGYTCGDLFLQDMLLKGAEEALLSIADETAQLQVLCLVGVPVKARSGSLYNCAAILNRGKILHLIPKTHVPNYSEFYELRHFSPAKAGMEETALLGGELVPVKPDVLFRCREWPELTVAAEICEDLWVASPPSSGYALAGAAVLCNLSASDETIGKAEYRRSLVCGQSAKTLSAYVYADAGEGESTTDLVFSGHCMVAENGAMLAQRLPFTQGMALADVDLQHLWQERRRMNTFERWESALEEVDFSIGFAPCTLQRSMEKTPFVPANEETRSSRCELIFTMQAAGLKKRLAHANARHAVVGLSGGLDSTLALLVMARAYDTLSWPREDIIAVTMPCFGTTGRTYQNACQLAKELGVTLKEINICEAVTQHLKDIGHDFSHDVAFENAQARERTQVLMDVANQYGGLVVGTGDLSELALGWATYNGDHMSMYGVNASVPKTLIRYLVDTYAKTTEKERLRAVLLDILDTPVSPELLPPENGEIAQKTEELVGPYELHDFFLYHMLRFAEEPRKILFLAEYAFQGIYSRKVILHWLKNFYRRFFAQQFKRSCLPDGPKVGSVTLSPRGDWRMPSDASAAVWLKELEGME
ncbi:MAG: NAD(+) synthase [Clostridiales bacterium]|nr:NAD(+) synthase [Clostridiales bacterium]